MKPSLASNNDTQADQVFAEIPPWAFVTVQARLGSLKARDLYTHGHCMRVGQLARLLAQAAGLDPFQQTIVEFSSMFHDLGKIAIPDCVLLKEGKLTPAEEDIIRQHPIKSAELIQPLSNVPFFRFLLPGVRHHH